MKSLTLLATVALAMLCFGCMDYEQTLTINKDGSGTVTMRYAIDKSYLQQMQAMTADAQEMAGDEGEQIGTIDQAFDKQNITAQLTANNWGIALTDYSMSETDKAQVWSMSYSFSDVNKLWQVYALLDTEDETDTAGEAPPGQIYSKQPDGTWLYEFPLNGNEAGSETAEMIDEESTTGTEESSEDADDFTEMTPEQMKEMGMSDSLINEMQKMQTTMRSMAESMSKHKLRFTTTFPGTIVESNAGTVKGHTAAWEIPLTDLNKDSLILRAVIKP